MLQNYAKKLMGWVYDSYKIAYLQNRAVVLLASAIATHNYIIAHFRFFATAGFRVNM